MGIFDTVMVKCPSCRKLHEFQSKGGECMLSVYNLKNCPKDVLGDVNRHSPYTCSCGAVFKVKISKRKATLVEKLDPIGYSVDEMAHIPKEFTSNKGICKITNGAFSWVIEVDKQEISIQGRSSAEYLRGIFSALGYEVIWNEGE